MTSQKHKKPYSSLYEITEWDALTLSKQIKNKHVSCLEVMQSYLDQIDRLNPKVNAIVSLQDKEQLLNQAQHHDTLLANKQYLGWMHGFPLAIKDLSATQSILSTSGSTLFKNHIPTADSLMVSRLKQAGAIIIGKTNTPEFGLGSHTYNKVYGSTKNAYEQSKTAGGSSGGAAVSLALQLLPVADGSDMMGSLRNPAAYNNVIGFRPSLGLIPNASTEEIFISQLATNGPMGRTVADTVRLLATQAGFDYQSPLSSQINPNIFNETLNPPKPLKIGWLSNLTQELPIEAEILNLCEEALKIFATCGHTIEAVDFPINTETIWSCWKTLRHWQVAGNLQALYEDPQKSIELKPEAIWEIEQGLKLTALDVFRASKQRSLIYQAFEKLYQTFDILVLPSAQLFPFDINIDWPKTINDQPMDSYHRWMEIVTPASLAGLPTLNVPIGFGKNKLPMGMQLMGRIFDDLKVLQLGHQYEQASRWNLDYHPCLLDS